MKVMDTVCVHLTVKNSCVSFSQRQAPVSRNDNTGISRSSEYYDFLEPVQMSLQIRRSTTVARAGTLLEKLHRQDPTVGARIAQE